MSDPKLCSLVSDSIHQTCSKFILYKVFELIIVNYCIFHVSPYEENLDSLGSYTPRSAIQKAFMYVPKKMLGWGLGGWAGVGPSCSAWNALHYHTASHPTSHLYPRSLLTLTEHFWPIWSSLSLVSFFPGNFSVSHKVLLLDNHFNMCT